MQFIRMTRLGIILLSVHAAAGAGFLQVATWNFGSNANGLINLTSKTLSPIDSFALDLSVHNPAGARFFEADTAGLTVNSTGLAGISDR